MKAKRVVGVLAALLLCICMIMPVNTDAAAQVRVRTVKGVTSSYTGRKSYCYVNGQKRKLTKYPIFKKSGAYMGPVGAILKNSKLKVKATAKGDKLIVCVQDLVLTTSCQMERFIFQERHRVVQIIRQAALPQQQLQRNRVRQAAKIRLRLSLMQDTVDQILVRQGMEWQRRT